MIIYIYIGVLPKTTHGVRICMDHFFTGLDFSCVFSQASRRGQCFIALYKLKITLAKFFSSQKSEMFCDFLSTSPDVFYCVLQ